LISEKNDFCFNIISLPVLTDHPSRIFSDQPETTASTQYFPVSDEFNLLCVGGASLCFSDDWLDFDELSGRRDVTSQSPKNTQIH
jgi:hypothetical protein